MVDLLSTETHLLSNGTIHLAEKLKDFLKLETEDRVEIIARLENKQKTLILKKVVVEG